MIAPDFRVSDQLDFVKPVKNFISFNYGNLYLTHPLR